MIKDHRGLKVWQLSLRLVDEIYDVTARFPAEERFVLTAQMRRAAISIPSNIAEGDARLSSRAYLNHLSISRGSVAELRAQIEIALRRRYMEVARARSAHERCDEVSRVLYALIRSMSTIVGADAARAPRPRVR